MCIFFYLKVFHYGRTCICIGFRERVSPVLYIHACCSVLDVGVTMAGRETYGNGRVSVCDLRTRKGTGYSIPNRLRLTSPVLCFLALLLLCSHSWGACNINNNQGTSYYCRFTTACGGSHPLEPNAGQAAPVGGIFIGCSCSDAACAPNSYIYGKCSYLVCDTQAESDSAYCALNPTAEGCAVAQDTTIFVCDESLEFDYTTGKQNQPYMQLYRCDCKWDATNHTGTCNGKSTNIDPRYDCEQIMNVPGTCNQNGYQNGPNTDTTGSSATCYAVVGSNCYMRDNRSGNTFTCACDGNCNYAYEQMIRGFCENPYFSSASQDSTFDPFSSASEPSSSGSEGGESSGSGGEGGEGSSGSSASDSSDFEYDYTSILEAIQANTQGTMNNTQNIDANFVQFNTNINNVTNAVNSASSNIAGAVNNASSNIGGKLNTLTLDFGEFTSMWSDYKDSILHPQGNVPFDSGYYNDSIGMFRDSVARHMHDIDSILDALGDTSTNYIVFDSIYDWGDTASIKDKLGGFFFNAPASNSCPVFDFQVHDMPIMGDMDWSIDFGNFFGRFDFCSLIRALVRLGTLIAIVLGTIQAFRKAFSNGG